MINNLKCYSLFHKFIQTYLPTAFKSIDPADPLLIELEKLTEKNNQFFVLADFIYIQVLYTSKRSLQMIGIEPGFVSPYHFFEATHPHDIERHSRGRSKLFKMAQQLFIDEKGHALLSTNLKLRNPSGGYSEMLFQCYLFYSTIPYKTVYLLEVHTNVDWFKSTKNKCHNYVGADFSYFRYPDKELLKIGNELSDREFEIIKLIESGLSSEQIAEKIFLSIHTVNTHRSNILDKTGFNTTAELIFDYHKRGLL
jgi:DNA-binding CsgD family transcriptional regulator